MKNKIISMLLLVSLLVTAFVMPVSAGVPPTDVTFTVTSLKVTSSPIEEENDITVEAIYHASVTNHGFSSSVWHQCGGCGGAGKVLRYGGGGGIGGGKTNEVTLTCGQSFEGATWMCREACDGNDYYDQNFNKGSVTHNTENPWDGDSSNSWDDGGEHIWGSQKPTPCSCSRKVAVGDKGANSGMIACRGCGGLGSIYRGTETCSSCKGSGGNCTDCGGSGDVKVFDQCAECSGTGAVTEYITCDLCGGAGGEYVTITHPPSEPVGQISTMVDIRLEGKILETKEITFSLSTTVQNSSIWTKEGDVIVVWTINTDEGIGEKDVKTDINEGEDSKVIPIIVVPACNLTVQFVPPNSDYRTGTEVISTFVVQNHNDTLGLNVRPKHKLTADFTATSGGKTVATKKVTDIVIPKGKSNIVYFKWQVPDDIADVTVKCDINTGYVKNTSGVNEKNHKDNTATEKLTVEKIGLQVPPDTQFEERAPSWFVKPNVSDDVQTNRFATSVLNNTTFSQWEWANDWYKLATYSIKLEAKTKLTPDVNSPSHKLVGTVFEMKSGYGVSCAVDTVTTAGATPKAAYTVPQNANLHLPEYRYTSQNSKFRTLDRLPDGKFELPKNSFAKTDKGVSDNRRIHFTPLFYPDGEYKAKSYAYDLWTPNGMLSVVTEDKVTISDDMYSDWYISHSKQKN